MTTEHEIGTDINRHWILDTEGRIQTVTGHEDIKQAIYNRLTCYLGNLNWAYKNYGSTTKDWLGKIQNPYNRSTLVQEISSRVLQDPRITECKAQVVDWDAWGIGVKITGKITYDSSYFEEYYIFTTKNETTKIDTYNMTFHDTYILTRGRGYYSTPDNTLRIHTHVLTEEDKRVPIGNVSIWIGQQYIQTLEILQSGTEEPGSLTFEIVIPHYIEKGEHYMYIKYHGANGYNPSEYKCQLIILDKLPTTTMIDAEDLHFYTDDYNKTHEGVPVKVDDVNFEPVNIGYVNASINITRPEYITVQHPIIYLAADLYEDKITIITVPELQEYTRRYIFLLSRKIYRYDIIKLVDEHNFIIDFLEVYWNGEEYVLYHSENTEATVTLRVYE